VQQHQGRKEGVQMHIEGIAPLNVRLQTVRAQIPIRHRPEKGGNYDAHENAVHEHHVEDEGDALPEGQSQYVGKTQRGDC